MENIGNRNHKPIPADLQFVWGSGRFLLKISPPRHPPPTNTKMWKSLLFLTLTLNLALSLTLIRTLNWCHEQVLLRWSSQSLGDCLREKRPRAKCPDRVDGANLLQAMSMGSVKPGGVCADASGCTCRPTGGGGRDVDDGSCVLKMLGNVGVVVVELNQACSAAGLLRDNSSRLQHANISVMWPGCVRDVTIICTGGV